MNNAQMKCLYVLYLCMYNVCTNEVSVHNMVYMYVCTYVHVYNVQTECLYVHQCCGNYSPQVINYHYNDLDTYFKNRLPLPLQSSLHVINFHYNYFERLQLQLLPYVTVAYHIVGPNASRSSILAFPSFLCRCTEYGLAGWLLKSDIEYTYVHNL